MRLSHYALKKKPTLSVLLSTKNQSCWIEQCISCVLSQSFQDFEFLILDDGSTDSTPIILKSLRKKNSRIRLLHHKKSRGVIESYNRLAKLAAGQYLFFCASDDFVHDPAFFQVGIDFLRKHPHCGGFFANCKVIAGDTGEFLETWGWKHLPELITKDKALFLYLIKGLRLPGASTVLRKDLFFRHGGYDKNLGPLSDLAVGLMAALSNGIISTGSNSVTIRVFKGKKSFGSNFSNRLFIKFFAKLEVLLKSHENSKNICENTWAQWRAKNLSLILNIRHHLKNAEKSISENKKLFIIIKKQIYISARYYKSFLVETERFSNFNLDILVESVIKTARTHPLVALYLRLFQSLKKRFFKLHNLVKKI